MDREDIFLIFGVILTMCLICILIFAVVSGINYSIEYWQCKNLMNLYGNTYKLEFVIPNGCLIKYSGTWINYSEFQQFLNLNMVK